MNRTVWVASILAVAGFGCASGGMGDDENGVMEAMAKPAAPSPGNVFTTNSDCAKNTPKFDSLEEVHVLAPRAPAKTEFFVKLYGPPLATVDLGIPQVLIPYGGECASLVEIFGDVFGTMNNGGVYKVEVCGDLDEPRSCFSQNFKINESEGEGGAGGGGPTMGTLLVDKYYYVNEGDPTEAIPAGEQGEALEGWRIDLTDEDGDTVSYPTPVEVYLEPGTYTVTERMPNESNWRAGTVLTYEVVIEAGETVQVKFGNYCERSPGGHTLGWWQNKNGEADMRTDLAGDLGALDALHLKNLSGDDQDFGPTDYAGFKSWLKGAKGNPMAYMLSAQLSSMVLAMRHGYTDGAVYVGRDGDGNWLLPGGLVTWADQLLSEFQRSTPDANKAEETRVKDWIDAVNNGRSFAQPTGEHCPYSFD